MFRLLILSAVLTSCSWVSSDSSFSLDSSDFSVSSSSSSSLPLETFPSEISVPYFAKMRLEGTEFTLGDVLAKNSAYTRYTITYKSNGLLISGILNIPTGEGPFPLFVLNHGYIDPAVYTNGRGLKREQDYLARKGFAVLHSDYRGHAFSDPSPLPDDHAIYDAGLEYSMEVINGIRALENSDFYQIDTSNISMLGHSLGGGVTMNIAVAYPDLIDRVILYAPVHTDAWENFARWRTQRKEGNLTIETIGTRASDPAFWDAISSLAYLEDLKAPILLFQGTNDSDVPKEWSDFLAEKLEELGKDIEYIVYEGEKHEFIPKWNDFMSTIERFAKQDPQSSLSIYHEDRITKKPFGLFITPGNSPVSPERFAGYHAGTDFEILEGENPSDIIVSALCAGTVRYRNWVKGYGGVFVQSCIIEGQEVTILYGHLALDSIPHVRGDDIEQGEFIGTLGKGYSTETDNERPHLHLSVHRGTSVELRGYAEEKDELVDWLDPVTILPSL